MPSVKSIPRRERPLLDPKAMYIFSVTEFEEIEDWKHADGETGAYRGMAALEGVVEGTSVEPFDAWMKNKKLRLGFYMPAEDASWYGLPAEAFTEFCDALGIDMDAVDPDEFIGKTFVAKVKVTKGKMTGDKERGTLTYRDPQEEFSKFYPMSFAE